MNATDYSNKNKKEPPGWLYDNIAEASKNARKIYFIYVAFLSYCTLTILGTTDKQIILNEMVNLPVLNMDSSLKAFFITAPIILILIFAYLQLYINKKDKLIDKLHKKYEPIDEMRIYPWILNSDSGSTRKFIRFLHAFIISIALWYSLPIVLYLFAFVFLKTHDPLFTSIVGALPIIGTFLASYFWYIHKDYYKGHELKKMQKTLVTKKILGIIILVSAVITLEALLFMTIISSFNRILSRNVDLSYQILIDKHKPENDFEGTFWGDFKGVHLENANLVNAIFERSDLRKADLERADLRIANLKGAKLWYANLKEAKLREADLEKAEFGVANLEGANLKFANLKEAYFFRANLERADLLGANLEGAYLRSANLEGAYLRSANLKWAELYIANLKGADLREADLEGARLYFDQKISSDIIDEAKLKESADEAYFAKELERVTEQFSKVETLFNANIDPILKSRLMDKYPDLFIDPKLKKKDLKEAGEKQVGRDSRH